MRVPDGKAGHKGKLAMKKAWAVMNAQDAFKFTAIHEYVNYMTSVLGGHGCLVAMLSDVFPHTR